MAAIGYINFIPFTSAEIAVGVDVQRHLIAEKYVCTTDDVSMSCEAILDSSGTLSTNQVEIYIRSADLLTTYASTTKTTATSNRVFFNADTTGLTAGDYVIQAYFATTPGVPIVTKSFNFTKTSATTSPVFPAGGIQIYPQAQSAVSTANYPMHAAVPLPKGALTNGFISYLNLYENGVQIPATIEAVEFWEAIYTNTSLTQNQQIKWLHVWFNANYVAGTPATYLLKKDVSPSPLASLLTYSEGATSKTFAGDIATATYGITSTPIGLGNNTVPYIYGKPNADGVSFSLSYNAPHGYKTGQVIMFSNGGSTSGSLTTGQVYYANVKNSYTFSLYPTRADALAGTNQISHGSPGNPFFAPVNPFGVKPTVTPTTSVCYPPINNSTVYYAMQKPTVAGKTASYGLYLTYNDAIAETNPIKPLLTTSIVMRLMSPRVFNASPSGNTWNAQRGYGGLTGGRETVIHGMATGQAVRICGLFGQNASTVLDYNGNKQYNGPDGIYYIECIGSVSTSTTFYVHTTLNGAQTASTSDYVVGGNIYGNCFVTVDKITVANKFISVEFSRPFNGIDKISYDSTGNANYTNVITDTSTISDLSGHFSSAGLYMKDQRGLDWSAHHDHQGTVDIEHTTTSNITGDVTIRAEGWFQTYDKRLAPSVRYSARFSIGNKSAADNPISAIKCQLAIIPIDTNWKINSCAFNLPVAGSFHFSTGVDGNTLNSTYHTLTSVTSTTVTTNTANGWAVGTPIRFWSEGGGSVPLGITQGTTYYVKTITNSTTFEIKDVNGSAITMSNSGSGVISVSADIPTLIYQKKSDVISSSGIITTTGTHSDGWFSATSLTGVGLARVTLIVKKLWQKFPKEISMSSTNMGFQLWPQDGTRNFDTATETSLANVYKYNCFHQNYLMDLNVPSDYYTPWATQTDAVVKPEWVMAANAQGVAINNEFTILISPTDSGFNAPAYSTLYQQDPIALCADSWNASSGAFFTMAEKGSDFANTETAIENGIIGWTNPDKVSDYGQFNYGDTHTNYVPSQSRANLGDCWQNGKFYFTSQLWYLIMRGGSSQLLDVARRVTDHYASVDQTRYDQNSGYYIADGTFKMYAPEHANHVPGGFWHAGPLHWANADYGMDQSTPRHSVWGSNPDPVGLLRAWIIDGNRWAKAGFEQWKHAVKNIDCPPLTIASAKEAQGTLTNLLIMQEYTHDPSFLSQIKSLINGLMAASANETDTITWNPYSSRKIQCATAHSNWTTGRRVTFTTNGTLPTTVPQIASGVEYFIQKVDSTGWTLHETLDDAQNFNPATGTGNYINVIGGNTGTQTMSVGSSIRNLDFPLWHPFWASWYYEVTKNPTFMQWILDNADPLGFAFSATAYSLTNDPVFLTRHSTELYEQPNYLHVEAGNPWNNFGVGPGDNKYFWYTFPHIKAAYRTAGISAYTTGIDLGSYPLAIGDPLNGASSATTILINTQSMNWQLGLDVASITMNLGQINAEVFTPSSTHLVSTSFIPPTATSDDITRQGGEVVNRNYFTAFSFGGSNADIYETATIKTMEAALFQPITPYPEAILLDNYANGKLPIFKTKSFKGYFLPKVNNADVSLNFTTAGEGGFTKILVKDDNGTTISNTSLMFGRSNTLTLTLNTSNVTNPTPWYVEATSGRNSYINFTVTGGDSTPMLFSGVKSNVVTLKAIAIGSPVSSFTASPTNATPAAPVVFTDTSINSPTSWSWNFGDGNTSTLQNPTHTYISGGTYSPSLTVSSLAGTDTHTATNYITVTDPLDAAPRWGWKNDPLAELVSRGEGGDIAGMPGGLVAIPVVTRIPILAKAPDGSILMISQPLSHFAGDNYSFCARMKRSTDNGVNWSAPYDAYVLTTFVPTKCWQGSGAVVVDNVTNTIFYFMTHAELDPPYSIEPAYNFEASTYVNRHSLQGIKSTDNGLTWTNLTGGAGVTDITSSIFGNDTNNLPYVAQQVASVNTGADTFTLTAPHGFVDVQAIRFTNTGGTLPATATGPLLAGKVYYARVSDGYASDTFKLYWTGSDASGAGVNPINIVNAGTGTHYVYKVWSWNTLTGQGIQIQNGAHAGRLIIPGNHRNVGFDASASGTGTSTSHCIYSDDHGATWAILGQLSPDSNESTIIETTTPDRLLMNCRMRGANLARAQAFSTDGGVTWGAMSTVPQMTQPGTWGSLQRLGNTLILSTPYDSVSSTRKQMSLFTSVNEGITWTLAKTVFYRFSSYSSLLPIDAEHCLLAMETGLSQNGQTIANDNQSYTTGFAGSSASTISLLAFSKNWLTGTPTVVADYFFNDDSLIADGVLKEAGPYGAQIIDYGGTLNSRAYVSSVTNTPSYTSTGIALTSANDDSIVLTEFADFNTLAGESITIEVEATVSTNGVLASNMTGGTSIGMRLECVGNVLQATVYDGSVSAVATGTTAINDSVRRCYAMVRNKSTNKLAVYINGTVDSSLITDSSGSLSTSNKFVLGMNPSGTAQAISATFHSCRITKKTAVAPASLKVAPRTKTTPQQFRNYTPPTPPTFNPTQLTGLETWLNATVDGGESAYADQTWSLTYPLPYWNGATIASYRDKSPNRYFFNTSDFGHNYYQTDSIIGPHIKHLWNPYANAASRWNLYKASNSVYNFIPTTGVFAFGMAVKVNGASTGPHILLDTQNSTTANGGWGFYLDTTTKKPSIIIGGGAGAYTYTYNSAPAMNDGNWWFVMVVGRGFGIPVDLYYSQYSGTYNPSSPNLPPALTKLQSTNLTSSALQSCYAYLSVGARFDGGSGSNVSLKNVFIYSNSAQFSTTDTVNAKKLADFNVQA